MNRKDYDAMIFLVIGIVVLLILGVIFPWAICGGIALFFLVSMNSGKSLGDSALILAGWIMKIIGAITLVGIAYGIIVAAPFVLLPFLALLGIAKLAICFDGEGEKPK